MQGKSELADKIGQEILLSVGERARDYFDFSLVEKRPQGLSLGPLGRLAEGAGLSFDDAVLLVSKLEDLSKCPIERLDEALLRLAASFVEGRDEAQQVLPRIFVYEDLPPKLRTGTTEENQEKVKLRRNTLVGIMGRWMEEEPIGSVIVNSSNFQIYEAGLLASARALSRNLNNISRSIDLLPKETKRKNPNLQNVARRAVSSQSG
jgi:hypothetical protein